MRLGEEEFIWLQLLYDYLSWAISRCKRWVLGVVSRNAGDGWMFHVYIFLSQRSEIGRLLLRQAKEEE